MLGWGWHYGWFKRPALGGSLDKQERSNESRGLDDVWPSSRRPAGAIKGRNIPKSRQPESAIRSSAEQMKDIE